MLPVFYRYVGLHDGREMWEPVAWASLRLEWLWLAVCGRCHARLGFHVWLYCMARDGELLTMDMLPSGVEIV
ncbi:hypothetical protein G1C95_1083 [Bifidobacterium sp. DSM 109957]|uniref:Uncharacterized protein n=1 Tax=Bifidobacterium oedipodis TaxID=2675322 RepID=A0A7Y0ERB5_9BIFI|nr:hypothetical protein [Bifidobacterium sp. DSM 109957]